MLLREVEYARPASVEEAIAPARRARRRASARRRADARQRDEGARRLARRARRPGRVDELRTIGVLGRRPPRARRDGHLLRSSIVLLRGGGRAPDPRRGRRHDRRRPGAQPRHDRRQRLRRTIRRTTCRRCSSPSARPSRSAGAGGERTVAAEDFFLGVYLTAVGEGELLTKIARARRAARRSATGSRRHDRHARHLHRERGRVGRASRAAGRDRLRLRRPGARDARWSRRSPAATTAEASVRAAAAGLGASLDPPSDVHASGRLPPSPGRGLRRARRPAGGRASEGS